MVYAHWKYSAFLNLFSPPIQSESTSMGFWNYLFYIFKSYIHKIPWLVQVSDGAGFV